MSRFQILVIVPLLACSGVLAEEYTGTVIAVIEGDMLSVQHDGKTDAVRLYAVDAPESGQAYADEARRLATDLALNKEVKVAVVAQDNLGKVVARVTLPDGKELNQEMVAAGMAWWDQKHGEDDRTLKKANAEAIGGKKGLWTDPAPLSPWDYRQSKGLGEVTYDANKKAETETAKSEEPEVKSVSAKGSGDYVGLVNITGADLEGVNVSDLLVKHKPHPVMDDSGKISGWTAQDIAQIPMAQQLGFREGDIATSVNGVPLGDMSSIMGMAQQFKDAQQLQVEVLRGGQPVTLTIPLR